MYEAEIYESKVFVAIIALINYYSSQSSEDRVGLNASLRMG